MNEMLNHDYAVLESQVRIAIVSQDLDPQIGYLHSRRPGRVALVYDLMEPLRPRVDHSVLGFVRSQTFSPTDFLVDACGVCRLHPKLVGQVTRLPAHDSSVKEVMSQLEGKLWILIHLEVIRGPYGVCPAYDRFCPRSAGQAE
jgi:CRISPR/Cas system-associated endonuclease Cas1